MDVNHKKRTGEKIKEIRKSKGLTQKKLAELCNMYESQIRKYESGSVHPKIETLQKIANALCVPVTELRSDLEIDIEELTKAISQSMNFQTEKIFTEMASGIIMNELNKEELNKLFDMLNSSGQEKAIEQVEMLTKIPEYQKKN